MKKETTLSRWGRYKTMVKNTIVKDTASDNLNERMEEVLNTAAALEVCSSALVKLAEEWGNEDAHDEVLDIGYTLYPIAEAFQELMVTEISIAISKAQSEREKPFRFAMKGEEV